MSHKLLLLPGDGIGVEVMGEVQKLVAWLNKEGKGDFTTDTGLVGLRVYGKAQHNGLIPISRGLLDALVDLHHRYAPNPGDPNTPLILKPDGTGISGRKFDSLFARIHKYAPWSANPAVTAHWFRHTTLQEVDFVSRREVAEAYAGNRNKKAIAIYAKVPFGDVRTVRAPAPAAA